MCEQCAAKTLSWACLPGWALVFARIDGNMLKAGQWGLLRCNDPDVIFNTRPMMDPEDSEALPGVKAREISEWDEQARNFDHELKLSPEAGVALIEAAKQAGYGLMSVSIDSDGSRAIEKNFSEWLFHRLGAVIKDRKPIDGFFGVESLDHTNLQESIQRMRSIILGGSGVDPDVNEKLRLIDNGTVPEYDVSPWRDNGEDWI